MATPSAPLFRRRPPSRGFGYDANGAKGWLATLGFTAVTLATAIPAAVVARGPDWPLAISLGCVVLAQTLAFVWFAKRESERPF